MPDELPFFDSGPEDLVLKAMLYVAGELDADEAAAFEQRLADDQAARDALCQAVELSQGFPGSEPAIDPSYRSRVRHRLRIRRRHRLGLSESPSLYNHPAFWSVLGAVIGVLLLVILSHLATTLSIPDEPAPTQPRPTPPATGPGKVPADPADLAGTWASLTSSSSADPKSPLPRFTEEREAAGRYFVVKQVPELLAILDELKNTNPPVYRQEMARIFQTTEKLAGLMDDPSRHRAELLTWKAETQANLLLARMSMLGPEDRGPLEHQLLELARSVDPDAAQARRRYQAWLDRLK